MMKKLVLFVAAVMLLASNAQALVNDVAVQSTAPTLVRNQCGQAGSLSLTFDQGTVVDKNQAIEAILQGGTFCKPVNLYVNATAGAVTDNVNGPLQGNYTIGGGSDFVLHVTAAQGDTKLTMRVVSDGTLTADQGGAQLVLFDGKKSAPAEEYELLLGSFNGSDWIGDVTNETAAENSLCVTSDLSDYTNLTLSLGPVGTKYKFGNVGANPPIAVIVGSSTISVMQPKAAAFMKVPGEQASCSFAYEADGCGGALLGSYRYFALKNGSNYPDGIYTLEMEILVNGASGDNGVYFESVPGGFQFTDALTDLRAAFAANKAATSHEYYLGTGAKTTKAPVAGCDRPDDQKITRIVSSVPNVDSSVSSSDYLRVNVPSVAVTKAVAKDEISIKVTITQGRCSTLYSGVYKLFTMVDKCAAEDSTSALLFPYFADAPFWNGLALTNTSAADVTATLTVVDAKGGEGTIDVKVPAKGMFVNTVEAIIADSTFNGTVDAAQRCYIVVTPQSGNLVGFAMMGNAGESMGYTVNN